MKKSKGLVVEYLERIKELKAGKTKINGYTSVEDFLLKNGTLFKPDNGELPPRMKFRRLHNCYKNSYEIARKYGYRYFVGYAYSGLFPVEHAWNVDKNGKVVDTTWKPSVVSDENREYFGVEASLPLVKKALTTYQNEIGGWNVLENRKTGIKLLEDYKYEFNSAVQEQKN